TLTIELGPGPQKDGYGLDTLQVAGHPQGDLFAGEQDVLGPLSVERGANWLGDDWKPPAAPFVSTKPAGRGVQPFLPGGGLRGPLRHAASRLRRGRGEAVRDPNDPEDAEKKRLAQAF